MTVGVQYLSRDVTTAEQLAAHERYEELSVDITPNYQSL